MEKDRKKELIRQYKEMKKPMGVFAFRCEATGQVFVGITQDLKGTQNSMRFQLNLGSYRHRKWQNALQSAWNTYGEEGFQVEDLGELEYDEDPQKTDYTEDLEILRELLAPPGEGVFYL